MHEFSLVQALFSEVRRALAPHAGATVSVLHVRVGELAGVEPELFRSAYETFRAAGGFASAELALTVEPAAWTCPCCLVDFARGSSLSCRKCGASARLARGGEIVLDRIEAEVAHV